MKKVYLVPQMEIDFLDDIDIVCSSDDYRKLDVKIDNNPSSTFFGETPPVSTDLLTPQS